MLIDEKIMETEENWHPSFFFQGPTTPELNPTQACLRVRFYEFPKKSDGYRVSVWGDDDFGMEKDFSELEFEQAHKCYKEIASPIEEEKLLAAGFDYA